MDSVDEINDCYVKSFYCIMKSEQDWLLDLGDQIKGETGLPFEEVIIESENFDEKNDPTLELQIQRLQ